MSLNFLYIIFLVNFLKCDHFSMIEVWGEPNTNGVGIEVNVTNWTDCMIYCYELEQCVAVLDTEYCTTFMFGNIQNITFKYGQKIAFKTVSNSDECEVVPSFPKTVSLSDDLSFEVSSTDNNYVFKYYGKSCDEGWAMFNRYGNYWCMHAFDDSVDWLTAQKYCESMNATISGLESNSERIFVWRTIVLNSTQIMVDGRMREECVLRIGTPGCVGIDAFVFTDPYLKTESGYLWGEGQPDEAYDSDYGYQSCIVLRYSGVVDDSWCDNPNFGYLCGKLAE